MGNWYEYSQPRAGRVMILISCSFRADIFYKLPSRSPRRSCADFQTPRTDRREGSAAYRMRNCGRFRRSGTVRGGVDSIVAYCRSCAVTAQNLFQPCLALLVVAEGRDLF